MKSPTQTIWQTVVFAGAMLAIPACGGKSNGAATMPENTGGAETADPCAGEDPCAGTDDPCAGMDDPCAGGEDPCAGVGRGFILS